MKMKAPKMGTKMMGPMPVKAARMKKPEVDMDSQPDFKARAMRPGGMKKGGKVHVKGMR